MVVGAMRPRRPIAYAWQGRFRLTIEGSRDTGWTIRRGDDLAIDCDSRGTTLDCVCRDAAYAPILAEILSRRLLPRLSTMHGRRPVHAAVLARGDGAVLLFGLSGAGKSTLTAAMGTNGWDILSDDMAILSGFEDSHVWQTAPGVSLWEPSRRGLGLSDDDCRLIDGYDGKYWYAPPYQERDTPVPVKAAIFLSHGPDGAVTWQRVDRASAVVMAASQMVRFNPADNDETARTMEALGRLVSGIPSYTLAYPRTFEALPAVIEAVGTIRDHGGQ